MSLGLAHGVLTLYYLILGVLALYGAHRVLLLALYYRTRGPAAATARALDTWPVVTVQLPIYNELYVAERLVRAVAAFDYPTDRLEIQVLDDSDDETGERLAQLVAELRAAGRDIRHLRRADRHGFKAGALALGLAEARGELLAVFDADFVPAPDFLRRTVPHFAEPAVGMVQARWDHLNRDWSLLTRIQAILLDGHFLIEHAARNRGGRFFNFNGTAGIWRRQAIHDAGGWTHDTLTEDLDLSYRAQLRGWRFLFLPAVAAPAELPTDIHAFKGQQFRWAKGSLQTARKLLGRTLRAPLPARVKLEALVHLTNNSCYLFMVALALLIFPAMLLRRAHGLDRLWLADVALLLAGTAAVCLFYVAGQRAERRSFGRTIAELPALMALGVGMSVNNCRAVVEGLTRDGGAFERTPKLGIEARSTRRHAVSRAARYRARSRSSSCAVEGILAAYLALCCAGAIALGMWLMLPFLALFLAGYAWVFASSLRSRAGGPPATGPLAAGARAVAPSPS